MSARPGEASGSEIGNPSPAPVLPRDYTVIGVMSGTSLDGVDLCCVHFNSGNLENNFTIVAAETKDYPDSWRSRLKGAFDLDSKSLSDLDFVYGTFLGDLVKSFVEENAGKLGKGSVDLIASHGHTIFHKPDEGITVQIGSGQCICAAAKIQTVCNFRLQDVQLGGQGAPLVPIGDEILFREYDVCLNLGGIANLSFQDKDGRRLAFDICPVNLVLNRFASKLGLPYDDGGELAKKGKLSEALYDQLNRLEFYRQTGPKSLGYEFVVVTILPLMSLFELDVCDVLHTFTEHIAYQIGKTLRGTEKRNVLVTGGGAYNSYLIERVKTHTPGVDVCLPSDEIVNYKEALIFALLGVLRIEGINNCLASVTGAERDHCSGCVYNCS